MLCFRSSYRRWGYFLISAELLLLFLIGVNVFQAVLLYGLMGSLLFYECIFGQMPRKKLARKLLRRLLFSVSIFFVLGWLHFWVFQAIWVLYLFRCAILALFALRKYYRIGSLKLLILGEVKVPELLWTGYHDIDQQSVIPENLETYVQEHAIEEVWIPFSMQDHLHVRPLLQHMKYTTVNIKLIPDLSDLSVMNLGVSAVGETLAIDIQYSTMRGFSRCLKWCEDKLLALLILILISPLMLVLALLIKLTSRGPVFYRQERVSLNHRTFEMLKFRSMQVNAEAAVGAVWASSEDTRVTPLGRFLRRTSLDELPQFINVLRGEMSIVGPRPERPVFVDKFKGDIPQYMQKHLVKAGITGLAQVRGFRGQTDLTKRIECDLQYIQEWSIWLDLKIIVLTFVKGFINKNAY